MLSVEQAVRIKLKEPITPIFIIEPMAIGNSLANFTDKSDVHNVLVLSQKQ